MLSNTIILKIIEQYQLGTLLASPMQIRGGRIHQLFYLKTTAGEYALKLLNPTIVANQTEIDNLELAETVAEKLRKYIHASVALTNNDGKRIFSINNLLMMIFPWVTGNTLSLHEVTVTHANIIGAELAKIHQANIKLTGFVPPQWGNYSKQHWQTLISQVKHSAFYNTLLNLMPQLLQWSALATQALPVLNQQLIISHRDFDHNNVVWQNDYLPVLIDWEFAGLINPELDLLITALSWSGRTETDPAPAIFRTIITAYQSNIAKPVVITGDTVQGYIGYCLAWLEYNLVRAQEKTEDHHMIAIEVERSINALCWVNANQNKLSEWVR